ncbi:hypothetical protein JCM10908_006817 [Rhodotorula pacifica]|uniref:uncharacterized protein n=1 Tax=Rhodotorula pacifica TaxID=1495444 RepID=UPI003177E473
MTDYRFINHDELVDIIRTKEAGKDYQVVDVRDDDYRGGNIKGSLRAPTEQRTDQSVQDLVTQLEDVPKVIFHCTLSQVRGPKAARIYAEARRAKEAAAANGSAEKATGEKGNAAGLGTSVDPFEAARTTAAAAAASKSSSSAPGRQEVLVLRDGFQGWQGLYRKDPELVENFDEKVWQDYSP